MKTWKIKWFIVVEGTVIILAWIISTIAFISFQWYTQDARNVKVDSDINTLVRTVEVKIAMGDKILDFVDGQQNSVKKIALSWYKIGVVPVGTYKAWSPNYTTLWVNENNFTDPKTWQAYVIGATSLSDRYQIAWVVETEWQNTPLIKGTYSQRLASQISTLQVDKNKKSLTLKNPLGFFKKWDKIQINNTIWEIVWVSADLSRLTLSASLPETIGQSVNVHLAYDESPSLIGNKWGSEFVTSDGTILPY